MKIRVGIFFGGPSRERESSFRGGRTLYDSLDRSLFEPTPVFVDSYGRFIRLDWRRLHKSAIRDFFPPAAYRPASRHDFPIYIESLGKLPADEMDLIVGKIGRTISPDQLADEMDLAFIAMPSGLEGGRLIQELLEERGIPYTGSGREATQTCLDEALEKKWMADRGYNTPVGLIVHREKFREKSADTLYEAARDQLGFPLTVRPAHYSSGIGRTIVPEADGLEGFVRSMRHAFFRRQLTLGDWEQYGEEQKARYIRTQTDPQTGLGFPIDITFQDHTVTAYHPERLLVYLNEAEGDPGDVFTLESHLREDKVIVERATAGQAFSCLVIRREDGAVVSLLPMTRERRADGFSTPGQPLEAAPDKMEEIRRRCEQLFAEGNLQGFAQVDGVLTEDGQVFWENIDTTPGFHSGDMIYHQGAVIGLTPSQLMTYLIRISLQERSRELPVAERSRRLMARLDEELERAQTGSTDKKRVAVLIGGDTSAEKQRSLESGRHVFEQLDALEQYAPLPVYVTSTNDHFRFHLFSPSFLLLKAAAALERQISDHQPHPELENIRVRCAAITGKYADDIMLTGVQETNLEQLRGMVNAVFPVVPGNLSGDGRLRTLLSEAGLPYTGPEAPAISRLANRRHTLEVLRKNGFRIPEQLPLRKSAYERDPEETYSRIESRFSYPLLLKRRRDDAGRAVNNRDELSAYMRLAFRPPGQEGAEARRLLGLATGETVERSDQLFVEQAENNRGGVKTLRIKVGLATSFLEDGAPQFMVFQPTEVLSGEQPNVTPARLREGASGDEALTAQIRDTIERAARVLNIQGYGVIEAQARLRPDRRVETTVTRVEATPDLRPGSDFFQQAALSDLRPAAFFDRAISFALRRHNMKLGLTEPSVEKAEGAATTAADPDKHQPEEPKNYASSMRSSSSAPDDTGLWAALRNRARTFFAELWRFVKSPIFIRNTAGLLLLAVVLYWSLQLWLRFYTHHNQTLQVDDYTGMRIEDAVRKAERNSFSVEVMDSFFFVDRPPGIVVEQEPEAFSRVKENRTIYLITTKKEADEVELPSLVGNYDYYQYARRLQRLNIRARIRDKQFSSKLEENTILHLYYDGRKITEDDLKRGVKVPMGSVVEFVITQRNTGMVAIPNLVCKTYDEAAFLITSMNLNIGRIYGEVADRGNAFVYKQEPDYSAGANVPMGTTINLYLTIDRPAGCD